MTVCDSCGQEIRKCDSCGDIIKSNEEYLTWNREDFTTNPHTFSLIYKHERCYHLDQADWYE